MKPNGLFFFFFEGISKLGRREVRYVRSLEIGIRILPLLKELV